MRIEIYGKPGCAHCKTTKNKFTHFMTKWGVADQVSVDFFDVSTPEGMAEGAFNDVGDKLPTTILRHESQQIARWNGVVPGTDDIRQFVMAGAQ